MRTVLEKITREASPETSKMDVFVTIVNSFQPSNIVTKIFIQYIARVLNPLLIFPKKLF